MKGVCLSVDKTYVVYLGVCVSMGIWMAGCMGMYSYAWVLQVLLGVLVGRGICACRK